MNKCENNSSPADFHCKKGSRKSFRPKENDTRWKYASTQTMKVVGKSNHRGKYVGDFSYILNLLKDH